MENSISWVGLELKIRDCTTIPIEQILSLEISQTVHSSKHKASIFIKIFIKILIKTQRVK